MKANLLFGTEYQNENNKFSNNMSGERGVLEAPALALSSKRCCIFPNAQLTFNNMEHKKTVFWLTISCYFSWRASIHSDRWLQKTFK